MEIIILTLVSTAFILVIVLFSYIKIHKFTLDLERREQEMSRKMYELSILKELDERMGYSLNLGQIAEVIVGSLHQLISYNVASYMLLEPEKVVFRAHIEQSVSRRFIDDIKNRMLHSLSALLDKDFSAEHIEEVLSGTILLEQDFQPVGSYFNIPLVIDGRVEGVLTVAHTEAGLYKDEEMTVLYKIIQQASLAITKLQEVVKTEQRKLNAMVESMVEGVVMTDTDYRIVVANPAIKLALGLQDKTELTIFDLIDCLEGKFDLRGKLEESIKLDKVLFSAETLIGGHFYQIFIAPVKNTLGAHKDEILGGVVILHDITHEKEVDKLREDFTSMMVHELRSPLDNIKKISEFLRGKLTGAGKKQFEEYLKLVYSDSSRMLSLVNDLLDSAKIEAGKFELHKEPSDIRDVIENRLTFFKTQAADAHIKLKSIIDDSVPSRLEFDPLAISQTLNNYLSNAVKFSKPGSTVTVQAIVHTAKSSLSSEAKKAGITWFLSSAAIPSAAPDSLIVAVTDEGAGISKEHIGELFNKFKQFQVNAASGNKKGTGLGLSIVKGIIEAHGGYVGAASQEGNGSTFYFTLPIRS